MHIPALRLAWLAFAVSGSIALAEPPAPTPVQVSVSDITDTRSTSGFQTQCRLDLRVMGDPTADAVSVHGVHLTRARDTLDRDLLLKDNEGRSANESVDRKRHSTSLQAQVSVRNPSRNATAIKVIEGEISLYSPTEQNGGALLLQGVMAHPGDLLANDTLKANKVEIAYLTKDAVAAKRKEYEAKQMKDMPGGSLAAGFANMFRGMFSSFTPSDSANAVSLMIMDPDKRVVDVQLCDATGKEIHHRGRFTTGPFWTMQFDKPPPADAQLMVYLATDAAIKTYPFKVENVPLP